MKNKKITMYELTRLIKNDKEPKKIKYNNEIYEYDGTNYISKTQKYLFSEVSETYSARCFTSMCIIEILPEENDEWETICELFDDSRYKFSNKQNGMTQEDRRLLDSNFKTLGKTINQLIKNQKYLKERLDKDE